MGEEGLGISIVTPEPAPLAALGEAASSAVGELLERARVRVYPNARPDGARRPARARRRRTDPELEAGRIVALPRIEGRPLRNVPMRRRGLRPG